MEDNVGACVVEVVVFDVQLANPKVNKSTNPIGR
jgi:hypothetical protein